MTIPNEVNKSGPYSYNGATTDFAYGFKISDETHIRVVETVTATGVEADLELTTDYTVTGVGDDTGTVVISPARASGKTVTLVRAVPFTQQTVLENQGAYFAKVVEAALDNGVARDQQMAEEIGRAIKVSVGSTVSPDDLIAELTQGSADAVAAAASATADAVQTAADRVQTGLDRYQTLLNSAQTGNDAAATAADVLLTAADAVSTAADAATTADDVAYVGGFLTYISNSVAATAADVVLTHADVVLTHADAAATAADRVQTGLDRTAAAASAASVDVTSMDWRRNMSVNGSLNMSQENGTTLGTTTGYFYADQKAMYKSGTLGISVQRVPYTSLAGSRWAAEYKCTTAKPSLGATDLITDTDFIEGSDPDFVALGWGAAGAKPLIVRKECGGKAAGTYSIHVSNKANNRHCWVQYTISAPEAASAAIKAVSIPGDTSGTWSKADGEIGAVIDDVLVAGSTYVGGTAGVWGASVFFAGAGQKNFIDNIANVARHTDFGMRADPDATGVYGLYRVGEVDAVYRAERYWVVYPEVIYMSMNAKTTASNAANAFAMFPVRMAKVPSAAVTGGTNTSGLTTAQVSVSGMMLSATATSGASTASVTGYTANARLS